MADSNFQAQVMSLTGALSNFARRFHSAEEDRNDLMQDTLLKAWVYRDKFQAGTNLKAWVFTIMRNTYINEFNKKQKRKTFAISEDLSELDQQYFVEHDTPEDYINKKELLSGISSLEAQYSEPLSMYHEGYKYEEIAEKLNIPIGTVKNRIFTARKKVVKKLV